jgi:hypothetical protein
MDKTNGKQPSGPGATLDDLLNAIQALQPTRHPVRRPIIWILAVCATAIIANIAVPGANRAFTTVDCYAKYLVQPHTTRMHSSAWAGFGVTSVKTTSSTTATITPLLVSDIWFGATMPFTRYCDYRLSFSAELNGPLDPNEVKYIGYHLHGAMAARWPDEPRVAELAEALR